MPLIPFPPYTPDVVDYESKSSLTITGVVPRADGYGPVPAPTVYSAALAGMCRGAFIARKQDGSVLIFAGTSTKLYLLNNTALTWSDVSKGAGTYTAVNPSEQWTFAQFGNFVIAVQANTTPQFYDLGVGGAFADLSTATGAAGTAPSARYVSVVGHFVVLTGLNSGTGSIAGANPYRIAWSGLDAPAVWDGNTTANLSDTQDLPDGGVVRGVSGGEGGGIIFQDFAIRTMTYTQENTIVFQIQRISQDRGLYGPYTLTRAGEIAFFVSPQGLYNIAPGQLPVEIGKAKFNRTLMADLDRANLQLAIGATDPRQSRILIAYKSIRNSTGFFDTLLCYDYLLDRASTIPLMGEYLLGIAQPGTTLEGLDMLAAGVITVSAAASGTGGVFRLTVSGLTSGLTNLNIENSVTLGALTGGLTSLTAGISYPFTIVDSTHIELTGTTFTSTGTATIGGALDALTTSLDSFANALTPEIAVFNPQHQLCFFRGTPLEAILDTPEQGTDGQRLRVRGFRPVTDAPVVFGSLVSRETVQATPSTTTESLVNAIGSCPLNLSTRYARGRMRIPAGTNWTFAVGVEPDFTLEGLR